MSVSGAPCVCGHPADFHYPNGGRCGGLDYGFNEGVTCAAACQSYRRPQQPPPTEAETLLLECFAVACYRAGLYDHGCLGTYRDAQRYLVARGLVEPEHCVRSAG